jgi:hypothetical protein
MPEELIPVGSFTSTLAVGDANIQPEIDRAGRSFGNLVLTTGKAVAETQRRLNETGAATATALANTLVDVIALQEKVYDDQGNVSQVLNHVEHLPLVNFIDPVFYEWSQVRLQGVFTAKELASATSSSASDHQSDNKSGQGGLLVIFGGGRTTFDAEGSTKETSTNSDSDLSFGNVRMNALLQPRQDVGVPRPTQVIQGPRLAIIHGSVTDVREGTVLTARTMDVLIQYHRRDGTPIAGKPISVETPGVSWSFTGAQTTDASGNLQIQLRREFLDADADRTQKDFVVTARIGIVQNSTTVTF